ncbi:hypothetical protein ABPG74_016250 [Tetrahymena malaccensis]
MKQQFFLVIALQLLILVSADNNCKFTVNQLNNQVLKTQISQSCKNCFTSDVKLTIESNTQSITSLKLTSVKASDRVQSTTLQPAQQSLTISTSFYVEYQSGDNYEAYNFMTKCESKEVKGNLVYSLTFKAKVNGNYQIFTLNNGYPSNSSILKSLGYASNSSILKSVSYAAFVLCMILIF